MSKSQSLTTVREKEKNQMRRALVILITILWLAVCAHGQGTVQIRSGATVPTNCTPKANDGLFYKNSGSNIGLYECTAANTWTFRGSLNFGGALTPTALTGNVNDYSPTNLGSSFAIRIDGGASDRNITGLATGSDGRLVMIINIGSTNTLTLKDASSSSTAANRFLFGADVVLGINQSVTLRYDGTTSRWRPFTEVLTSSGVTAGSYGMATITVDAAGRVTAASSGLTTVQTLGNKTLTMGGASTNLLADSVDPTKTAVFGLTNITAGQQRTINVPDANTTTTQARTPVDSVAVTGINGTTGVQSTATFDQLLSTTPAVDMNTATATTLYTSPTGRSTIIKSVTVRNCSTSITTASYSFGWNSATFNDVIANATHTELTGSTLGTSIAAKVGFTVGTSTGTFKVLMNTLQGGAATCTMDVWGYTF